MTITIDSHQHFWQRSLPFDYRWLETPANAPICRDFLPEHLQPHLQATGINYSVFVQTQHNLDENRWALALADANPFLAGVVGWVDLASPACEDQLLAMRQHPRFVGVRHITQDEPDDDFIVRPEILRGLRVLEKHGVPFDFLFYVKHLRHAATLAQQLRGLPLVIDHLAKPHIRDHGYDEWRTLLHQASAFPNVYCKLSGLVTEANWRSWTVADLQPYLHTALEFFGPQRCMFGSDWPVCELAGSYERVHAALLAGLDRLSAEEREAVLGKTALRFYRLPIPYAS
jgi:L-fuconolactonase